MQEVVKLFGQKFSSVVGSQGFDLHVGLIFHQGLVCLEFVKHLSFCFQKVTMGFSQKVIDEGDKVSFSTTRCGLHRFAHIAMHKFQKFGSFNHFIFRKRCLLMFPFNASFTHMVQWHFFQIHAIDHFFQLQKACHVKVAESLVPKCSSFIRRLCHICTLHSNINVEKIQVFLPSCFCQNNSMDIVHLTTILVKLHFQALRNEITNRNETIFHFGNMKNLSDGCKQHSTSNLHCGLDTPFANGLQNGFISHVHLPGTMDS